MKTEAAGRKVEMVPIIRFSDDTNGNRSKKWHKFENWFLLLAGHGLPRHENGKPTNIHFVCYSESITPLDMAGPICEELMMLESEGVEMYDAKSCESVLVVAPLMIVTCDNPRAYELVNHLESSANKYCRICEVSGMHYFSWFEKWIALG